MEKRPLSVVYADDDPLMRETVTRALRQAGIDMHVCADGAAALELCAHVAPDVMLLDLNMPEMNGLQIAWELRRNSTNPMPRLVALTGRGSLELRKKAMDAGFDEYLVKPVGTDDLIGALTNGRVAQSK